jgi:VWFA-related protein
VCILAFAASFSFFDPAFSQKMASAQSESSDYILRVNANLVILSATVADHHNALVSGLKKENFQIYEDRVLQTTEHFSHEDIPVTVGLVIDNSGSMGPKRSDVIAAALSFAGSSNPRDQMFVVNFNEHVSYGLPPATPFTGRQDQLQRALATIQTAGETALYDAIATAIDHLKQGKCDKKVLIVISDGGDNASKYNLTQITAIVKASDAIIYTIGIYDDQDSDQNPSVLKRFAKETGGEAFFPTSSTETASICDKIAQDIRNQYTLAYVPSTAQVGGAYRSVEVKANSPGHGRLTVRTRTGYFMPSTLAPTASRLVGHDSYY